MWTERARISAEAQATVLGPHGAGAARDAERLVEAATPKTFVGVRDELAVYLGLWLAVALVQVGALVVVKEDMSGHWGWALGVGVYIAVLQWFTEQRPALTGPVMDAPEQPAVSPLGRQIWSALGVFVIMVVFFAAVMSAEDPGVLIAIQLGGASGTALACALAYLRVRALEHRAPGRVLRLGMRSLRVDGREPSWSERRVLGHARFIAK